MHAKDGTRTATEFLGGFCFQADWFHHSVFVGIAVCGVEGDDIGHVVDVSRL